MSIGKKFENNLGVGLIATLDLVNHIYAFDDFGNIIKPEIKLPDGWEVGKIFFSLLPSQLQIADFGCCYVNHRQKFACYVSRGSQTLLDWTFDDFFGIVPLLFTQLDMTNTVHHAFQSILPRVQSAAKNIQEMLTSELSTMGYSMFVAGHSLGGFIVKSACLSHDIKIPVVSFNGPGLLKSYMWGGNLPNVLEVTNSLDLIGNYRNAADNELFVHTKDYGPHSIVAIIPLLEFMLTFFALHGLEDIRSQLSAAMKASNRNDIPLYYFNGEEDHYTEIIKKTFANNSVFTCVKIAGDIINKPAPAPAPEIDLALRTDIRRAVGFNQSHHVLYEDAMLLPRGTPTVPGSKPDWRIAIRQTRDPKGEGNLIVSTQNNGVTDIRSFPITLVDGVPMVGPGIIVPNEMMHELLNSGHQIFKSLRNPNGESNMSFYDQISLLHGQKFEPATSLSMEAAFSLFIKLPNYPDAVFFAKACGASGAKSATTMMLLFGKWIDSADTLQVGDLVYFHSPFIQTGSSWGILAERKTDGNHRILYPDPSGGVLLQDLSVSLERGWHPNYEAAISESSPQGAMWGPMLSKLRGYIERCDKYANTGNLLSAISNATGKQYTSIKSFTEVHQQNLLILDGVQNLPYGSIIVTRNLQGIGVFLSDNKVLGIRKVNEEPSYWSLPDFGGERYLQV
jgi:hypothetical protein